MNFFESQSQSHRKTGLLVFLLFVAVVCTVAAANGAAVALYKLNFLYLDMQPGRTIPPTFFLYVSLSTLLIILSGALYRFFQMKEGGQGLASILGATLIPPDTTDNAKRKLLNVVEEMAIASGMAVPRVYMLNEPSINALAAGYHPSQAVIIVTEGAVSSLTRDELQGVVAHEFSHIFNGDMRLNCRIVGILGGILLIGSLGGGILRVMARGRIRGGKGGGIILLGMIFMGVSLFVIGYVGVFIGRLIKSAVSRQREFLADASAVQFTRNPLGLSGVLKKILNHEEGSLIHSLHAEEASHMFFGEAVHVTFSNLLATHPPLMDRIRAIDPMFAKDIAQQARLDSIEPVEIVADDTNAAMSFFNQPSHEDSLKEENISCTPLQAVKTVGNPSLKHTAFSSAFKASLPSILIEAARDPQKSKALVLAIVLSESEPVRENQLDIIRKLDDHLKNTVLQINQELPAISSSYFLSLVDLSAPAIKNLPNDQQVDFLSLLDAVVEVGSDSMNLVEYAIPVIIHNHLDESSASPKGIKYQTLHPLQPHFQIILSALVYAGADDEETNQKTFQNAAKLVNVEPMSLLPVSSCDTRSVFRALLPMKFLEPNLKGTVIEACATCVMADGVVTPAEGTLLRVISALLECPMPPLLPDIA